MRAPSPNRRVAHAERLTQVVTLRRQRLTQDEIGRRMGISQARVSQLYSEALALIPAQQVEEHRAEELILIDDAIADLMPIARDHARPRSAVEAWNAIRGWAERKAKLLGLDQPERLEVITIDEIDREIANLNVMLAVSGAAGG